MRLAFLLLVAAVVMLQPQTQTAPSPNAAGRAAGPTVVRKVDPEYTKEAIEAKLEGTVLLATTVGTDGLLSDIRVVKGLGKGLDEKAVECLRKWSFKAGTRDGEPIPVTATVAVNFRLPQSPLPSADSK
jgi:TonB family protein